MLAYHEIYEEIITDVDQLLDDDVHDALVKDGSVEDAMLYFESKLSVVNRFAPDCDFSLVR